METQLFTEWGKDANPRQNPSQPLHWGSHVTCPCNGFGAWGLGASGSLVKAELPGHVARHSQVTGFKDAMGSAVVFDVLWREALEVFKASLGRGPKADSLTGNPGDSALGAGRQAPGEVGSRAFGD